MKKFRSSKKGAYLVSLNKNYAPMPVTENSSFKSFGRVRWLMLIIDAITSAFTRLVDLDYLVICLLVRIKSILFEYLTQTVLK